MFKKLGVVFFVLALVSTAYAQNAKPTKQQRTQHADRNNDGAVDKKEKKMEKNWEAKQRSQVNTPKEARMDANQDGRVGKVEAKQFNQEKRSRLDANNDGEVDKTEVLQARSQVNTPKEAMMDANNDGVVDEVEAKQFKENREAELDTNNDGMVDRQEKINARAVVDTKEEAQFDENGDGVLDASEAKGFLKARRASSASEGEKAETDSVVEEK